MKGLYKELEEYSTKDIYPMHMPGHKRNEKLLQMINPYAIDITEIDGFDNMHAASGLIKDIEERCTRLYGSKEAYISVSGSSIGLLASIAAGCMQGDAILIARNCHKAVYNAIYLNGLRPVYIYPNIDKYGISGVIELDEIKRAISEFESTNNKCTIKTAVITSPTYEGIVSNIKEISSYLHEKNISLIVDSAHGAHLGFCDELPQNMIRMGADVVIHSIHKTLPAFTQTALVQVAEKSLIPTERVKKYMTIYQSSSPSYILMAGIDKCMQIIEQSGKELFDRYIHRLNDFYRKTKNFKHIRVLDKDYFSDVPFDFGKIIITSDSIPVEDTRVHKKMSTGEYIYRTLLEKYKIQLEMKSLHYALAMTSICDTDEGFNRLYMSLKDMDDIIDKSNNVSKINIFLQYKKVRICVKATPLEADNYPKESINFSDSRGCVCADYIYMFPPGIPLLVPGEIINDDIYEHIEEYMKAGMQIYGIDKGYINVIRI